VEPALAGGCHFKGQGTQVPDSVSVINSTGDQDEKTNFYPAADICRNDFTGSVMGQGQL
jgi:hypothetical protein